MTTCTCGRQHERPTEEELYQAAVTEARRTGTASILLLQRRHFIGFNFARRLFNRMVSEGIAAPGDDGIHRVSEAQA